ncbi:MAG: dynamin family protein [Anaerolineae bacterium]|nr:dynamin family protein [Anaerolineae bacterium]MDW8173053.1 dynamin family protein [Anaerolineae bacterium]
MSAKPQEIKLIQDYEAIRQGEAALISDLLELLPNIDQLGEERVEQVRDALFHADYPFMIAFVGPFSAGKSSLINALLGSDVLRVGIIPTTDKITIVRYGESNRSLQGAGEALTIFQPSPLLEKVSLVDTPGLESVFRQHEQTTRRFLHRADMIFLVMLATQAMTQSNAQYMQLFKDYGKKVILVINQADLLSEEERETVRQYVSDQARDRAGFVPEVWLVSARQGMEAQQGEARDEALWQASGMALFERAITQQLSDTERMRQKLQTPLHIVQNVHQAALNAVKQNQATFDQYRNLGDNLKRQMAIQRDEQLKMVREANREVEALFGQVIERSHKALSEIFALAQPIVKFGSGVAELFGLTRFFRRADRPSVARRVFDRHQAFQPLDELPRVLDKLAPRLEGQDNQDLDSLVKYGQRELASLPPSLQNKVIGTIQAPLAYDRSHLLNVRSELEAIAEEARNLPTERAEQARRSTLIFIAAWELILGIILLAVFALRGLLDRDSGDGIALAIVVMLLVAMALGFVILPLRGRFLRAQHANQLYNLQERYKQTLSQAADAQIEYGQRLRREALAPLLRFIEAQTQRQDEQFSRLKNAEQVISKLEADLNALGKRKLFGLGG